MTDTQPSPDAIMQLTRAYSGSRALVSAAELDLFTTSPMVRLPLNS